MLNLYVGADADRLAAEVAALLSPPSDPFTADVVAVGARGVENWLTQRLSLRLGAHTPGGDGALAAGGGDGVQAAGSGDGVIANVQFPTVAQFVDRLVSQVSGYGDDATVEVTDDVCTVDNTDPWHPAALRWAVRQAFTDILDDPESAVLRRHLLAPDVLTGATAGAAGAANTATAGAAGAANNATAGAAGVTNTATAGAAGAANTATDRWAATATVIADRFARYANDRPAMLVDWAAGGYSNGLDGTAAGQLAPEMRWQARLYRSVAARVGVPGPAQRLEAVEEALRRDPRSADIAGRVVLFGPTRLSAYQLRVLAALAVHHDVHLMMPFPGAALWEKALANERPANTLLASLSREISDFARRVAAVADTIEVLDSPETPHPTTVLATVQQQLRGDIPAAPRGLESDGSLTVFGCHGPTRQVEVLREYLLGLFASDRTLSARDVIVMCPAVESYAPLIHAAFGDTDAPAAHPGHSLPVRIADRGLSAENTVLTVLLEVLRLVDGRVRSNDAMALAAAAPVARRFRFSDDDLERVAGWLEATGVRWGWDAADRATWGLDHFAEGTFAAANDRLLLGVSADEERPVWFGDVLPLDDVDSGDIELVGRWVEFLARFRDAAGALRHPQSATHWTAALGAVIDQLTDSAPRDAWQAAAARKVVAATFAGADADIFTLAEVRGLLDAAVAARPTRSNFRTGEITVCTMVPMRAVPHRVVVLLGLDDESFPRNRYADGDDVLTRYPLPGDRDPAAEDRQLLLDAVRSAKDHLAVIYSARDAITGRERAPAVPVDELIDAAVEVVRRPTDTTDDTRQDFVQIQPLQPFAPANFASPKLPSFDAAGLRGARSLLTAPDRRPAVSVTDGDVPVPLLPAVADSVVSVQDLLRFYAHPARAFLRQRIGISVAPDEETALPEEIDIDADGLQRWQLGERLLARLIRGDAVADVAQAERLRGTLPPQGLGISVLRKEGQVAEKVARRYTALVGTRLTSAERRGIDVDLEFAPGRRLVGDVDVTGNAVTVTTFSSGGPRHFLQLWVQLLVAAAVAGITDGLLVDKKTTRRLVAPDDPVAVLRDLIELRDLGLRAPLPLPVKASQAFANTDPTGIDGSPLTLAQRAFNDNFGDRDDPSWDYVYPGGFTEITQASVDGQTFADLAVRVWQPLLPQFRSVTS